MNNPRSSYITGALEKKSVIHYLGVGSNLFKSKVVNRGMSGGTISVISFEPALEKTTVLHSTCVVFLLSSLVWMASSLVSGLHVMVL